MKEAQTITRQLENPPFRQYASQEKCAPGPRCSAAKPVTRERLSQIARHSEQVTAPGGIGIINQLFQNIIMDALNKINVTESQADEAMEEAQHMFFDKLWYFAPGDNIFSTKLGTLWIRKQSIACILELSCAGWLNDESINLLIHVANHVLYTGSYNLPDRIGIPSTVDAFLDPGKHIAELSVNPQDIEYETEVEQTFCDIMSVLYSTQRMDYLTVILDVYEKNGILPKFMAMPKNITNLHWQTFVVSYAKESEDGDDWEGMVEMIDYASDGSMTT